MIESVLVADVGVVAARVIHSLRALGVKTVAADVAPGELSDSAGSADSAGPRAVTGTAGRVADDVVLLGGLSELSAPGAVVKAAGAAGVAAIHPGRGPLRADRDFAFQARADGFTPVVSYAGSLVPAAQRSDGAVDVCVLADATGCALLGTVGRVEEGLMSPAPLDSERARQIARAVVAQAQLTGLLSVVVVGDDVVAVDAGLPVGQAALEQVTGLNLVELQLTLAGGGALPDTAEFRSSGAAVTRGELDVVPDERLLDDLDDDGLRLDLTPRRQHGRETIVWATGFGVDAAAARSTLARYAAQLATIAARG